MTRSEFERRAQEMIGLTLAGVSYYEIEYGGDVTGGHSKNPYWGWNPRFDSIDYGLDLQFDGAVSIWISWGSEFCQYNLEIERNTAAERSGMRKWDVSADSRWRKFIGRKIIDTKVDWAWAEESSEQDVEQTESPLTLRIIFESGETVQISASEIRPDGSCIEFVDNITVFFGQGATHQFGLDSSGVDQR